MSAQTKVKVITEGADLLQASGQRSSFAVDYRWNDDASFYSSTDDSLLTSSQLYLMIGGLIPAAQGIKQLT